MTLRDSIRRVMRMSNNSAPSSPLSSSSASTTSTSSSASSHTTAMSSAPVSSHSLPIQIPIRAGPSTSTSSATARRTLAPKKSSTSLSAPRRALAGLARHAMNQHPRVKPLTKGNMAYQEMLSDFTMTFGATKRRGSIDSAGGISPCTSRRGSMDMEFAP